MTTDPNQRPATPTPNGAAGNPAAEEPTVEIPTHEQELARLKQERDHLEAQLQRTLADTANMRRRQNQEMDEARRRVLEGLTRELLPVLDTFAAALQAHDQGTADAKVLVDGVRMVRSLLSSALERHGLQEIAALGQNFDPARHEAVATEPSDTTPEGQVLRVLQTGYQLGDRVVRHSRVVVAKGKPQS